MHTAITRIGVALFATIAMTGSAFSQTGTRSSATTQTFTISDKVGTNQFVWNSDAPLEKIRGTAEGIVGSFQVDPRNISTLRGTITVPVASMKSGNATRDEHLRAATWLDAEQFPMITFAAKSVSGVKSVGTKSTATVTGDFTMHGVTRQVSIPVEVQYLPESAATRKRAPGDLMMLSAEFDIALRDFNVAGSQGVVGSKVGERISITAQLFGSAGL